MHRHRPPAWFDDGGADVTPPSKPLLGTPAQTITVRAYHNFNTTGAFYRQRHGQRLGCSNFDGRTVTVGGVARTCGQLPLIKSADGFTYFAVTAGTFPWASLFTW